MLLIWYSPEYTLQRWSISVSSLSWPATSQLGNIGLCIRNHREPHLVARSHYEKIIEMCSVVLCILKLKCMPNQIKSNLIVRGSELDCQLSRVHASTSEQSPTASDSCNHQRTTDCLENAFFVFYGHSISHGLQTLSKLVRNFVRQQPCYDTCTQLWEALHIFHCSQVKKWVNGHSTWKYCIERIWNSWWRITTGFSICTIGNIQI